MVMVEVAAGVPESTLTVAVEVMVPPAGGVTGLDENDTCTPEGKEPGLRLTGELNDPRDVTVTVSSDELPAATLRVGAVRDNPKSAPDVTVRVKLVEWVVEPPVPLMEIMLDPTAALGPTLTVSVEVAVPPDGMLIGFGVNVENVTPDGTEPVIDKVTEPE